MHKMNLRTRAFVGLLCIGLAQAQLNYRPEFISAGQGFRAAASYQQSSPGLGNTVTTTQERVGSGLTTTSLTSGVRVQPFLKKTTVTSHGYDYPVPQLIPCYEPNKVCTPNAFCVDGFVEESQLNQFNTNNQNCNSAEEQCCKIRPNPPPTQCPDDSYVTRSRPSNR
ncbi:hypothetical protein pipiens_004957 [Culex pipiens pipiens]|uniref:Uncharacterized protein n=1 Tax=Culex pipiens pipiens TaxID=38569 RepID=A0ABD1CE03_CULPP